MKTRLDQVETRLQAFLESAVNLFPWADRRGRLAHLITSALRDSLGPGFEDMDEAPNIFVIHLHPDTYLIIQDQPEFLASLANTLQAAAQEIGIQFISYPVISLIMDPSLPPDGVEITVNREGVTGQTAIINVDQPEPQASRDPRPANAFLILEEGKIFPLRIPVINIGRRPDNQLVINDPRVSRNHAQLRAARGCFIVFDLNSTGGTFVNNQRINQHVLKPGDVISLAGVPLIYGEDSTPEATHPSGSTTNIDRTNTQVNPDSK